MRKAIAILVGAALGACSIIEDDFRTSVPVSSEITSIAIKSDGDPGNSLLGEVERDPLTGGITVNWTGNFNPFWFPAAPNTIKFDMTQQRVSKVIVTGPNNWMLTEDFTYDGSGKLSKVVRSWNGKVSTYNFFYKDNRLDSIAQTLAQPGMTTRSGFFKRSFSQNTSIPNQDVFFAIMPFDKTRPFPTNFYDYGNGTVDMTNYRAASLHVSFVDARSWYGDYGSRSTIRLPQWTPSNWGTEVEFSSTYGVEQYNLHNLPKNVFYFEEANNFDVDLKLNLNHLVLLDLIPEANLLGGLFVKDSYAESNAASFNGTIRMSYGFSYSDN